MEVVMQLTNPGQVGQSEAERALAFLAQQGYDVSNIAPPVEKEGKKKIRLVFYGDAPSVATGFGKVSSNILPVLHNSGDYEIYCFGVNYMGVPHPFPFQIYPMLPNPQGDPYGREKIKQILPQMEFDIAFFLQDSFILKDIIPDVIQEMKRRGRKFRTLVYYPIDGVPDKEWIQAMAACDQCVTYTNYGLKQSTNRWPDINNKLSVIPHGISMKEFFPHPPERRAQLRQMMFGPHASKFIVMNVNRNQQRKDLPASLLAFKEFKRSCPNSIYYMHCAERDVGWNLPKVVENMGMKIGEDVIFPKNFNVNAGYPVSVVNDLYNCANVIISTALGEGWGLSSVEAMATKTPAIFPDNTSLTEIFADGRGFLAKSGDTPNMKIVLPMDNDVVRPRTNINDLAKYLRRLYEKPEIGARMADKAYEWVLRNLQWEQHIVPKFDALIKNLVMDLQRAQDPAMQQQQAAVDAGNWRLGEVI
jgi:glycosyltransferase involved in cell wall biosynthesis